jgi:hypothetical protein
MCVVRSPRRIGWPPWAEFFTGRSNDDRGVRAPRVTRQIDPASIRIAPLTRAPRTWRPGPRGAVAESRDGSYYIEVTAEVENAYGNQFDTASTLLRAARSATTMSTLRRAMAARLSHGC